MDIRQNVLDCLETHNLLHNNLHELATMIASKLSLDTKEVVSALKELVAQGDVFEYDNGKFASIILFPSSFINNFKESPQAREPASPIKSASSIVPTFLGFL